MELFNEETWVRKLEKLRILHAIKYEEVKKVLNSESSNLCTIVIRNVKNIMGNKANDFGSFNTLWNQSASL